MQFKRCNFYYKGKGSAFPACPHFSQLSKQFVSADKSPFSIQSAGDYSTLLLPLQRVFLCSTYLFATDFTQLLEATSSNHQPVGNQSYNGPDQSLGQCNWFLVTPNNHYLACLVNLDGGHIVLSLFSIWSGTVQNIQFPIMAFTLLRFQYQMII